MKNNQRNNPNRFEELAAQHASKVLQTKDQTGLNEDERQISELGQLIRQSASMDLPQSNPDLRNQILKHFESESRAESVESSEATSSLASIGILSKEAKSTSDSTSQKRTKGSQRVRVFWSAAASAALAVGGWWVYSNQPSDTLANGNASTPVADKLANGTASQPVAEVADEIKAIKLVAGSSQQLKFGYMIPELLVENPEVISANAVSQNEIVINGVKPGTSTFTVSDPDKNFQTITVEVTVDVSELNDALALNFKDAKIEVAPLNTGVLLSGSFARADQLPNILEVAQVHFPDTEIVNDLQLATSSTKMLADLGLSPKESYRYEVRTRSVAVTKTRLESKTRHVPVTKMTTETKTRTVPVTRTRLETKIRTLADGSTEKYQVSAPYTENVTQQYTVQVPVTSQTTQSYQIAVPYTTTQERRFVVAIDGNGKEVEIPVESGLVRPAEFLAGGEFSIVSNQLAKSESKPSKPMVEPNVNPSADSASPSFTFDGSRTTAQSSGSVLDSMSDVAQSSRGSSSKSAGELSLLSPAGKLFGANPDHGLVLNGGVGGGNPPAVLIAKAPTVAMFNGQSEVGSDINVPEVEVREIGQLLEKAKLDLAAADADKRRATLALNNGREAVLGHLFKLKQRSEIGADGSRTSELKDSSIDLRISELNIQLKSLLARLGNGHRSVQTLEETIAQWERFRDSQKSDEVDGAIVEGKMKPEQTLQLYVESLDERIAEIQSTIKINAPRYQNAFLKAQKLAAEKLKNAESYAPIHENSFKNTTGGQAVSTFSIDVDTASYANMRRFINNGQLPPPNSVRLEELVNYFDYDYPQPEGDDPFSVNMELASCPWNKSHKLLRVGLKGKEVHVDERPATNVVFLIDVSGSMSSADKLPLLKRSFQMMVNQLNENDRVAIVTYAGNAGVALEPTNGSEKRKINEALRSLNPGGSTHGSAGIKLAYEFAQKNFIHNGVNKVILATDGDLNVGVTQNGDLVKMIKEKAAENVFLTVLGFGTGNIKDDKMEALADNGNGMYAYIDGIVEAKKVLVDEMSGSLVTIAKDVKIQIEFNPAEVTQYRLVGYENRMLATEDFDDDKKDAGEIGAGHTVTAIYELVTTNKSNRSTTSVPANLKYQQATPAVVEEKVKAENQLSTAAESGELLTLALRYKQPEESESKRIEFTINNDDRSFGSASEDFRFAASVASFGMLLRNSKHKGETNSGLVLDWASVALGEDESGYRAEFLELVRKVESINAR